MKRAIVFKPCALKAKITPLCGPQSSSCLFFWIKNLKCILKYWTKQSNLCRRVIHKPLLVQNIKRISPMTSSYNAPNFWWSTVFCFGVKNFYSLQVTQFGSVLVVLAKSNQWGWIWDFYLLQNNNGNRKNGLKKKQTFYLILRRFYLSVKISPLQLTCSSALIPGGLEVSDTSHWISLYSHRTGKKKTNNTTHGQTGAGLSKWYWSDTK